MKKAKKSLIALFMVGVFTLNITPSLKTNAAYTKQLQNYPTYLQSGENCWAYAILSMANFSYGGYSINNIYNAFSVATGNPYDYNGANVDEALKVIILNDIANRTIDVGKIFVHNKAEASILAVW